MRMKSALLALLIPGLFATAGAADSPMRPGLWQVTTTSDLLKLLPRIPPDQMQQLMALAKQHGIEMPQMQNGAAVSHVCISPEMAASDTLPGFLQNRAGCTSSNAVRSGNQYHLDFSCANAQLKGKGTAQGTFTTPERFTGRTTFEGVAQGNPLNEHADINGKWVATSCTESKPL
jgi:hypothetical protein